MSDATPALEFRDIACLCGPRPLFDGFDLEVPKGKVLGVLGPNGCGKSTLLGLADGLGMPARGTVLMAAALIFSKPPLHRRVEMCLLYDGFFSFAVVRQNVTPYSIQCFQ